MVTMRLDEVRIPARDPEVFRALIGDERTDRLLAAGARIARLTAGRSLLQVNSTATGGGVAEMLQVLLPYARFAGADTRWLVIEGDPEFFLITKRLHNHLYGTPGDGGPLGAPEAAHLRAVAEANAAELAAVSRSEDILVIHDPQPAGLAAAAKHRGLPVVWRCHVGIDTPNEWSELGWEFLRPFLEPYVDRYVFTRAQFAPAWVPPERLHVIAPSIDPFNAKNRPLDAETVNAVLAGTGLARGPFEGPVPFTRADGSTGRVEHFADVFHTGPAPDLDMPLVVQISRWDHMKDMVGVMAGFAEWVVHDQDSRLLLAGPSVTRVADDPEGSQVLEECWRAWRELPHGIRARVQLACLPMIDAEENAIIVNAVQRHAAVVVQKSLAEGFGLTVAEAMLKGRPIIASRIGGIPDQIVHGRNGLLVDDPTDLSAFEAALGQVLENPRYGEQLGATAREDALAHHIGDVHLVRWAALIEDLLG
jgi:trehalose synthase